MKAAQLEIGILKEEKNKEINKYKQKLESKRKELQSKCKEYADYTQKTTQNEKVFNLFMF